MQLLANAAAIFGDGGSDAEPVDLSPLYAKIGQLALENIPLSWHGQAFRKRAHQSGIAERKKMISPKHDLPTTQ